MGDIGLFWASAVGAADVGVQANDLSPDNGLETAVLLSLFTDRRAEDGDILPDRQTDRRGWWADAFPVEPGDRFGSRLWLLARSKNQPSVLRRAEEYAREALQWMIDDKVSDQIDISTSTPNSETWVLAVTVNRPNASPATFRFDFNWAAQQARRG